MRRATRLSQISVLLPGQAGYRSAPDGVSAGSEAGPQMAMAWPTPTIRAGRGPIRLDIAGHRPDRSGWRADTERFPGSSGPGHQVQWQLRLL